MFRVRSTTSRTTLRGCVSPAKHVNEYSQLKVLQHPEILESLASGGHPPPIRVLLYPSDFCSHDCHFCAYRWSGYTSNELFGAVDDRTGKFTHNPRRWMTTEKALEIVADCQAMGVKSIEVAGGGEPTVHPEHPVIFRAILDAGIDMALVTHGALLKPATIELLTGACWVRVSLDAGRRDTYAKIRRVSAAQFDAAMRNIERLAEARDRSGRKLTVGVSFVVLPENWQEAAEAARLVREAGADTFRIGACFQPDDERYYAGWYDEAAASVAQARELGTDNFRVIDLFGRRIEDLRQGRPKQPRCHYMQVSTVIGADLNVYRCCNTAYSTRGLLGSLVERTFRELWDSQERHDDAATFDARGCERCMFGGQNAILAAVLDAPPTHANFV